ncbi:MAG: DUF190 domain-containing protein [Acidobacteria bacterium]|nr:DUF190 domain-containing protein [Acidobacteriota bacterium]
MTAKALLIFIDENDRWHELPLYEALVQTLAQHRIAGATVTTGLMGYGIHRRIHRKGLFGIADDKPVTLLAIDDEQKLRDVIPFLQPLVKEGLIILFDVEVIT